MAFEQFTSEHPYLTFFLGIAAIHGVVTIIRGREPLVLPSEFFAPPHHPPHLPPPAAPLHPAMPRTGYMPYLVGAPAIVGAGPSSPSSDYSFTRRPGFNDKNY
jgi:hypothetical protein